MTFTRASKHLNFTLSSQPQILLRSSRLPTHNRPFPKQFSTAKATMPLSLYEVTIPAFISSLKTLSSLLEKGLTHTSGNEEPLLASRLIEDMQPLPYQIQRVSDTSKGVAVRLGKVDPVPMEDNEKTFPELQARLKKTIEFLESVDPKSMDGMEDEIVKIGNSYEFSGKDYVTKFALPNFYFHYTTAYALLRKEGVPIGKKDFMGAA